MRAVVHLALLSSAAFASSLVSRRRVCIGAASGLLVCRPKATAARGVTGGVADVLEGVPWEPSPAFSKEDFRRLDESDDLRFYDEPRLVYHVDDAAVDATRSYYNTLFEQLRNRRGGAPLDALDLCSSWTSHYPDAKGPPLFRRVAGLGMNREELAANKLLSDFVVQDLNKSPKLPYADASFDAVTCTVSIDYLTKPLDVMSEVARVLRPGGIVAVVFSDRLFFSKAVAVWTGKDDEEHIYTVGSYMHYGGGDRLSNPRALDLTPKASRKSKTGDPLYVVYAEKLGVPS